MPKRFFSIIVSFIFIFNSYRPVDAQVLELPLPGQMLGPSAAFTPLTLKGLVIDPKKPLEFQFIVDPGDNSKPVNSDHLRQESSKLVKYFLAGLTIPDGELWVNLSPYEKARILPDALAQTVLGRDMLAEDYILKQLSASLIYPEKSLGKEFWSKVYAKTLERFGTTNVPVNTFNKVWVVPDKAQIFESGQGVYITRASLKVMLDEDYLALTKHRTTTSHSIASEITRQIVLPQIEDEVNEGRNFACLRQIYNALILAKWYKESIEDSLLQRVYTNKNKVAGISTAAFKEQIYRRYVQAYKRGVFNYIKEEPTGNGQLVAHKYFSGGEELWNIKLDPSGSRADIPKNKTSIALTVRLKPDQASVSGPVQGYINESLRPLLVLDPQAGYHVVFGFMQRRYDKDHWAKVVGWPSPPELITYTNPVTQKEEMLTPEVYAERKTEFLERYSSKRDLDAVTRQYKQQFPHIPLEVVPLFMEVARRRTELFDVPILRPILDILPKGAVIADFGAGRNELGHAIRNYLIQRGRAPQLIVATDRIHWPTTSPKDRYSVYVDQESNTSVKLEPGTVNLAINFWMLHHVSIKDQYELLKNERLTLKEKGQGYSVIFEPFVRGEEGPETYLKKHEQGLQNPEIERVSSLQGFLTGQAHIKLTRSQQIKVLALEDWVGHRLEQNRPKMPLPFSYLPTKRIDEMMKNLGMEKVEEFFMVVGSLRSGPPVNIVSVYKTASAITRRPSLPGGENLTLMANVSLPERNALNTVLDTLVPRDYPLANLEGIWKDDVVLQATENMDVISEALKVLDKGAHRLIILDNPNVNMVNLIGNAVKEGLDIEVRGWGTVNQKSWNSFRQRMAITPANQKQEYARPPQIIKQIVDQLIKKSINTEIVSDVTQYRQKIQNSLKKSNYTIVFVAHDPLSQFPEFHRFHEAFSGSKMKFISHTVSLSAARIGDRRLERRDMLRFWLGQALKSLSQSKFGLNKERFNWDYPDKYWDALDYLLKRLDETEGQSYAKDFLKTIDAEEAGKYKRTRLFLTDLKLMAGDKAMTSPMTKDGGIDFNQIHLGRSRAQGAAPFNPSLFNDFSEKGFAGFTPIIMNITPVQDPLVLFGVRKTGKENLQVH